MIIFDCLRRMGDKNELEVTPAINKNVIRAEGDMLIRLNVGSSFNS